MLDLRLMYGVVEWSFMHFFVELFHLMMRIFPTCSKRSRWERTYADYFYHATFSFLGIWSPSLWLCVSGRYLHSSESFICFGQGFDPKNACCRAYEENHNSWNSRASMVPVSPSSLFGGASTRHGTASQNGISSCIWVVMPLLYACIQLFLIMSTNMQEKVFRLFI